MAQFIAFEVVPFAATLFIWFGGAMLIFVISIGVAVVAFGKPMRDAETGAVVPPAEATKTFMAIGGASLFLVVVGLTLSSLTENSEQDPEPILWVFGLLNLFGALFPFFLLWLRSQRRT